MSPARAVPGSHTAGGVMEVSPARGNWIWLATGGLAVAIAALAAFRLAPPGCLAAAGHAPAAARLATRPAPGTAAPAAPAGARPAGLAGGSQPALPSYSGRATYYDPGAAVGSCLLGPFPAGGRYAALSPAQFAGGHACGTYLTVRGPAGTVQAEVVDMCPACPGHTINLSRSAYTRIGDVQPGVIRVTYRWLADPRLPGALALRAIAPSPGELAVQVLQHGNRLASVAISRAAAGARFPAWQRLSMTSDGFWVARGVTGPGTFTVRITDALGHQVILPQVELRPGAITRTGVWMYRPAPPAPAARPAPQPARQAAARPASRRCPARP